MLTPVLKNMDAFQVIGMMCITTMKSNSIPKLWGEFNHRKHEIPNTTDFEGYLGICFGDSDGEMTEDTPFNYMASAIVSSFDSIPEGMVTKSLPAAEYAVFEHRGALDNLDKTYTEIYQGWFANREYKPTGDYDFELYDARFKFGESDSIMEIWIPVQKR